MSYTPGKKLMKKTGTSGIISFLALVRRRALGEAITGGDGNIPVGFLLIDLDEIPGLELQELEEDASRGPSGASAAELVVAELSGLLVGGSLISFLVPIGGRGSSLLGGGHVPLEHGKDLDGMLMPLGMARGLFAIGGLTRCVAILAGGLFCPHFVDGPEGEARLARVDAAIICGMRKGVKGKKGFR